MTQSPVEVAAHGETTKQAQSKVNGSPTRQTTWTRPLMLVILWLGVTAGVAFLVATYAADEQTDDITAPLPPISLAQRETASISTQTITPIVSADGTVIQDGSRWLLEAPASPPNVAYRLLNPPVGVKALIDGGPAGFDCAWVGLGQGSDGAVTTRCALPAEVPVAPGMTGTMVLQMDQSTDAPALPVAAVVGTQAQGQVVVVADGETSLRTVELGVSDAFWIEIRGGLEPGETVLAFPTQSDFGKAGRS